MKAAELEAMVERGRAKRIAFAEMAKIPHAFVPHKHDNQCDACAHGEESHVLVAGGQAKLL